MCYQVLGAGKVEHFDKIGRGPSQHNDGVLIVLRRECIPDQRGNFCGVGEFVDAMFVERRAIRIPLRQGYRKHRRVLVHLAVAREPDRQRPPKPSESAANSPRIEPADGFAKGRGLQIGLADTDRHNARLVFAVEAVEQSQRQSVVNTTHVGIENDPDRRFALSWKLHATILLALTSGAE